MSMIRSTSVTFWVTLIGLSSITQVYSAEKRDALVSGQEVELTGVVEIEQLIGDPNFHSTKSGDRAYTGFFLKLRNTVSVIDRSSGELSRSPADLDRIQVMVNPDEGDVISKYRGKNIRLHGTIMSASSGYNVTPYVLIFSSIIPLAAAQ